MKDQIEQCRNTLKNSTRDYSVAVSVPKYSVQSIDDAMGWDGLSHPAVLTPDLANVRLSNERLSLHPVILEVSLESGDVFVRESTEFRCFEDELISEARWKNKDAVLSEIGAPILVAPVQETLNAFHKTLEAKLGEQRRWNLLCPTRGGDS